MHTFTIDANVDLSIHYVTWGYTSRVFTHSYQSCEMAESSFRKRNDISMWDVFALLSGVTASWIW